MKRLSLISRLIALLVIITIGLPVGTLVIPRVASAEDDLSSLPALPGAISPAPAIEFAADPAISVPAGGLTTSPAPGSVWHVGSSALNATALASALSTQQSFFEWAQEFVLEALKKRILDMMVDQIVDWVQGGDDPKFITDWEGFLDDAGDIASSAFIEKLGVAGLCGPLQRSLQAGLPVPDDFNTQDTYACTLDQLVGNIDTFFSDFSNGGWAAYLESWQPNNNYVSTYIMVSSDHVEAVAAAREAAELEGLAGKGFQSSKTCFEATNSTAPDLDGDGTLGDVPGTCRITTPGSVIGDLTSKAVGADIDFIVNAEQLATYVAAITDALIFRLINEGVNGLSGVSTDHAGLDTEASGAQGCDALAFDPVLFASCSNYENSNGGRFATDKETLLANISLTKTKLEELKTALSAWLQETTALVTFLESQETLNRSLTCMNDVLEPYNMSVQGFKDLKASLTSQISTIDTQLATLQDYQDQIGDISSEEWGASAALLLSVEQQLPLLTPAEETTEEVQIKTVSLINASDEIQSDIQNCPTL
jgi:hypothetical protein